MFKTPLVMIKQNISGKTPNFELMSSQLFRSLSKMVIAF